MGQAKNRKAEIAALKTNGRKSITPFILRGKFVDGKAVYDTTGLEPEQIAFVDGNVKTFNEDMIPEWGSVLNDTDHLTFVSYLNDDDFIGFLSGDFTNGHTPNSVWADAKMRYDKRQAKFPEVGFTYTRDEIVELGTEMAGITYDSLKEGGVWPWPNAHAVFQKQGDLLVVIKSI